MITTLENKKNAAIIKIENIKLFLISKLTSIYMVSRDGLEPSTHSLKGNCSTN